MVVVFASLALLNQGCGTLFPERVAELAAGEKNMCARFTDLGQACAAESAAVPTPPRSHVVPCAPNSHRAVQSCRSPLPQAAG